MAARGKKTKQDYLAELEAMKQKQKEIEEQLKSYVKQQTDTLGKLYFELRTLDDAELDVDTLVDEISQKVANKKKAIKAEKERLKAEKVQQNQKHNQSENRQQD